MSIRFSQQQITRLVCDYPKISAFVVYSVTANGSSSQ